MSGNSVNHINIELAPVEWLGLCKPAAHPKRLDCVQGSKVTLVLCYPLWLPTTSTTTTNPPCTRPHPHHHHPQPPHPSVHNQEFISVAGSMPLSDAHASFDRSALHFWAELLPLFAGVCPLALKGNLGEAGRGCCWGLLGHPRYWQVRGGQGRRGEDMTWEERSRKQGSWMPHDRRMTNVT